MNMKKTKHILHNKKTHCIKTHTTISINNKIKYGIANLQNCKQIKLPNMFCMAMYIYILYIYTHIFQYVSALSAVRPLSVSDVTYLR